MPKNKKQKNKLLENFLANQKFFILISLVFVLTVSASAILYSSYQNLNFLSDASLGSQAAAKQLELVSNEEAAQAYKKLGLFEAYIRNNMSLIAPKDSVPAVIDSISFICGDRALIFYHDQSKNLISEVVLKLKDDSRPELAKVYLKNSGDNDYSQGVYGADPN